MSSSTIQPATKEQHSISRSLIHSNSFLRGVGASTGTALTLLLTMPFDNVKVIQQLEGAVSSSPKLEAMNPLRFGADLFKKCGFRGLYAGFAIGQLSVIPSAGIYWTTYEISKAKLSQLTKKETHDASVSAPSSVLASMMTALATNPLWLVRARVVADQLLSVRDAMLMKSGGNVADALKGRIYGGSSIRCAKKVWKQEGLPGFYRGLSGSWFLSMQSVVLFVLMEKAKKQCADLRALDDVKKLPMGDVVLSSVGASAVANLICYPFDLARARMQGIPPKVVPEVIPKEFQASSSSSSSSSSQRINHTVKAPGVLEILMKELKQRGPKALYAGVGTHLSRTVVSQTFFFLVLEKMSGSLLGMNKQ